MTLLAVICLLNADSVFAWSPEEVIRKHLLDKYPWEEIEISGLRFPSRMPAKAPDKIIVEKGPLGRATFSFIFGTQKTVFVKANVKAMEWVVKSRRPFRKGHLIKEGDIYLSKMDIRKMPNSSIQRPEVIIGKSLKRSISANIPIVENMIKREDVVKRGKMVDLVINQNGLSIRTAGKTKEKGHIGMTVRVVNLSSRKIVQGILIDESTVRVEL